VSSIRLTIRTALATGILIVLAALCMFSLRAEEIWLYDNSRVFGFVRGVSQDGKLGVLLHTGEERQIALEEIIAIRFLGRNPLLVQSGVQEFHFIRGGKLRGQILQNDGDRLKIQTALAGAIELDLSALMGFVALPMSGFIGRKAEELADTPPALNGNFILNSPNLDMVLDRRASSYACVLSKLERTTVQLDFEETLASRPLNLFYLAGVRLADATRQKDQPWRGEVQLRVSARDGSVIEGTLERVHLGKWQLRPAWDSKALLALDVDEISLAQVQGGRVQYLSQLAPVEVREKTILSAPQPYQMDHGCQGEDLSIAGKRYPWGIGAHADCEITFELDGRFKEFHSDAGIATRMGKRGSVVFAVYGDKKELFRSGVRTGADAKPLEISIPVGGVKRLTLQVTNGGDLDLGDAANWGSARLVR